MKNGSYTLLKPYFTKKEKLLKFLKSFSILTLIIVFIVMIVISLCLL